MANSLSIISGMQRIPSDICGNKQVGIVIGYDIRTFPYHIQVE